ncbi:hypothetical protein CHU92_11045 [Flavobacterium cyanobacteriorum]|uniref:HTH araC/xylS-type domain-containing protein n=1 Tax=Flavobacterium cyanobacteriorum TaxID=2022802 RepID=A0A255Z0W6_9FLAO|nr:helix-turn-helix domain-containing protein [Flavobacterium cyanobacteriorum]OYQ35108.1 hypothetical protein CHU92_11045 [Flavobacterium cyanobacteriorum]
MKLITTIADYCTEINIPAPRHSLFDIRRFEDNMRTVNAKQHPFRHEFYALALRHQGSNSEVMGNRLDSNLFFNSPYQIITWDILPDWQGYYILFDRDFIAMNPAWNNFIIDYPFFRLDKSIPFNLPDEDRVLADYFFKKIFEEYHSENEDKFQFIIAYTQLLLNLTKRYFNKEHEAQRSSEENRTNDIILVSRFQSMIENSLTGGVEKDNIRQAGYYADKLGVHPNYLNAVVKRITNQTASQIIQGQLIVMAKSLLLQTPLSIKEIGYRLGFTEPTHFAAFFKKHTGKTPVEYRK